MEQQQLLDTLCSTADGVFIVDAHQRIVRWNKGAERILKYSEAEALNQDCYRLIAGRIHPDKAWCRSNCKVQNCVRAGTPLENFDLLSRTKDGTPLWTNVSILSHTDGGEALVVHLIRDVSREKQAGEAIEQFLRALGITTSTKRRYQGESRTQRPKGARTALLDIPLPLSKREIEVLQLLAEGLSTKALAQKIKISRFTARNHIQNILTKLDLHSKAQAVSYAFKRGLL